MKLIAETPQENTILDGLTALLGDLGIETDSYRQEEALALTFFSADNFALPEEILSMSREEKAVFLISIEDAMRASMMAAGYRTMQRALRLSSVGISHIDRHLD